MSFLKNIGTTEIIVVVFVLLALYFVQKIPGYISRIKVILNQFKKK